MGRRIRHCPRVGWCMRPATRVRRRRARARRSGPLPGSGLRHVWASSWVPVPPPLPGSAQARGSGVVLVRVWKSALSWAQVRGQDGGRPSRAGPSSPRRWSRRRARALLGPGQVGVVPGQFMDGEELLHAAPRRSVHGPSPVHQRSQPEVGELVEGRSPDGGGPAAGPVGAGLVSSEWKTQVGRVRPGHESEGVPPVAVHPGEEGDRCRPRRGEPECANRCWAQSRIGSMRGSPFQTAMSWPPRLRVPVRVTGGVVGCATVSHQPPGNWSAGVQRRTESMRCSRSSWVMRVAASSRGRWRHPPGSRPKRHVHEQDQPIDPGDSHAVGPTGEGGRPRPVGDVVERGAAQRDRRRSRTSAWRSLSPR